MKLKNKSDYRRLRHRRLRQKIQGSSARPRMCVCITNKYMYVQFIDDQAAVTLAGASTAKDQPAANNRAAAERLGQKAAEAAKSKGITEVVFDRGGRIYSGRVKAVAEAARAAGLKI